MTLSQKACYYQHFKQRYQALLQHPHAPQVDHNDHVFPPQAKTFLAQLRLEASSQGGFPPEQDAQFIELIYQRPISLLPLLL